MGGICPPSYNVKGNFKVKLAYLCKKIIMSSGRKRTFTTLYPGVTPRTFRRGAGSSEEGAKIWSSGYYKCLKSPKNRVSPSDGGLACSDGGYSLPLAPPLPISCETTISQQLLKSEIAL